MAAAILAIGLAVTLSASAATVGPVTVEPFEDATNPGTCLIVTCVGGVAISGTGQATAYLLAVSGTGNANSGIVAVSGAGNASSIVVAVSGMGTSFAEPGLPSAAVSGTGPALGDVAVSGTNTASACTDDLTTSRLCAAVSGTQTASGYLAVSGTGHANGGAVGVSGTCHAEGGLVVSPDLECTD